MMARDWDQIPNQYVQPVHQYTQAGRHAPQPQPHSWPREYNSGPQYYRDPLEGKATAALVLGIVSLVINILFVPSILAIVFGAQAMGSPYTRNKGGWGMALGIIGATFGLILYIAILSAL